MTADLKPCPFCGCTTIKRVDQDEDIAWYECAWCQVAGPVEGVDDDGQPQGWNTRAPTVSDTEAERDAALAQVSAWQPIETAPRDGTPVLTYSADAAADPRQGPVGNPGTPILVMAYIVGEWELVDEIGDWHIPQYDPTHWMPLPAPPVDSSAAPSTPVDNKISADPVGKEG